MGIISVCHGWDKDYNPVCDTLLREATVFIRAKNGQMVSRTGTLAEIIETTNGEFLGVVIDETARYPKREKGFLAKAKSVVYIDEFGTLN